MSCAWTEGVACDGEVWRVASGACSDSYSEEQLRHVVKQVLNGLQWLHNRFVVHGVVVCDRGQFVEHPARQSVLDAGG